MPLRTKAAGGRTVDILCEEPTPIPDYYPSSNSPSLERRIRDFSFGAAVGPTEQALEAKNRQMSEDGHGLSRARFESFTSSGSTTSLSSGFSAGTGYSYSSSAATSLPGSPADFECGSYSSTSWSSYSSANDRSSSVSLRTNSSDSVPSYESRPMLVSDHRSRSLQAIPQKRTQSNPEPDGRDDTVRQRRYGEGYAGGNYSSGDERPMVARRRESGSEGGLPGIGNLLGPSSHSFVRKTSPRPSRTILASSELSLGRTMPIPLPVPGVSRPSLLTARHNSLPVLPPAHSSSSVAHFTAPNYQRPLETRIIPPQITPSPPAGLSMRQRGLSIASEDAYDENQQSRYPSSSRTPSPAADARASSDPKDLSTSAPSSTSNSSAAKPIKRKFPCTICGKYFTTSGHLSRHGRTHTGEKNYECPYKDCGSRFSRQDNCMQHYRTHMADESRRRKKKGTSVNGTATAQAVSNAGSPPASPTRTFKDGDALATLANVAIAVRGGELEMDRSL